MARNIQLLIAYDGTEFHGWQTQAGLRTVQAEIETVAQRVVRHPVKLIAAGRTDAGVHAAGQVANFHTECALETEKLRHAIGGRLSRDISLRRVRVVPDGFHATLSARRKLYRYRVWNGRHRPVPEQQRYLHHCRHPLDVERMCQAARHFVGTHDFKALASTRGQQRLSTVRTIFRCEAYTHCGEVRIDVCGDGFLYNQVRNMVGTLLEVGRGHWPPDCIVEILQSRDRQNAGRTAPANGLCMQWVKYPPDHLIPHDREPQHELTRKPTVEALS